MFLRRDTLNNLFKNYDFQYFIKENEILKMNVILRILKKTKYLYNQTIK